MFGKNGKCGFCDVFYDPAFGDANDGNLRGAYASAANADAGPRGIGDSMTAAPEFASCAVERVTASFLGRQISSDDDNLSASRSIFVDGVIKARREGHSQ